MRVKRETVEFVRDEHIREDASPESMARLRPVFKKDGTVTAGNASGMNDAGAAVVLMSAARAGELGVAPSGADSRPTRAAVWIRRSWGSARFPPSAGRLRRRVAALEEVQVIELNEAFAAQALAVIDDLGLDEEKVNPNGGAIALGHPIGATGTRSSRRRSSTRWTARTLARAGHAVYRRRPGDRDAAGARLTEHAPEVSSSRKPSSCRHGRYPRTPSETSRRTHD